MLAPGQGQQRTEPDLDQPLGSGAGLRINGMYEDGESFRDHVELERWGLNPTVGVLVGPRTRLDFSYEHLRDGRTTDRGVPSENGRPLKGFDSDGYGFDPQASDEGRWRFSRGA